MSTFARDLANALVVKTLFDPASRSAASTNGTGVDMVLGDGLCSAYLHCGAFSGGTNPTLAVHIEESDDDSSYTDVSGATFATLSAAGVEIISFQRTKKYIRAVAAITGSPSGILFGVSCFQQKKTISY